MRMIENHDMDMCDGRIGGGMVCPLRMDCLRYINGQESGKENYPYSWWISGKSFDKFYADEFMQQKIEFKEKDQ